MTTEEALAAKEMQTAFLALQEMQTALLALQECGYPFSVVHPKSTGLWKLEVFLEENPSKRLTSEGPDLLTCARNLLDVVGPPGKVRP